MPNLSCTLSNSPNVSVVDIDASEEAAEEEEVATPWESLLLPKSWLSASDMKDEAAPRSSPGDAAFPPPIL
jgi:hypothetical protein